jgi:hypothetical protein
MRRYYLRGDGVASRLVDGEAILVKLPENVLYVLNPAASCIWAAIDGVRSDADLATMCAGGQVGSLFKELDSLGLLDELPFPLPRPERFPQDLPGPQDLAHEEPPRIVASERVALSAGCGIEFGFCSTSPFGVGAPPPEGVEPVPDSKTKRW